MTQNRMASSEFRVLTFMRRFYPGFRAGGPVRSVFNMTAQLRDEVHFKIVARDRDAGDDQPYPGIPPDQWIQTSHYSAFYRSPGFSGWSRLITTLEKVAYDVLYLNSLYSVDASLAALGMRMARLLTKTPVLVAPRGELNSGAIGLKTWKKRPFIAFMRHAGILETAFWHASSEEEATLISRHLRVDPKNVFVAPNLTAARKPMESSIRRPGQALRIAFLSRISPMKNLEFAIQVLSQVHVPVQFDIFGTCQDQEYWYQCRAELETLPAHITARYRGEVQPADVIDTLSPYDLFFLPTLGENFGHAIHESLSAGTPVLISDRTPWNDVSAVGAGASLPLESPLKFVKWIEDFSALGAHARNQMRRNASMRACDPASISRNLEANLRMFRTIRSRTNS